MICNVAAWIGLILLGVAGIALTGLIVVAFVMLLKTLKEM
jgi:hypothetical protein